MCVGLGQVRGSRAPSRRKLEFIRAIPAKYVILPFMKHRKLPHVDMDHHYQFITFRTLESLDTYLAKIYDLDMPNSKKQMIVDLHLDSSTQGAYLYGEQIDIFKSVVLGRDGILYDLLAMAVMPNHVHLLLKQIESLSKIIKYIKAKSAIDLNKALNRNGQFWAKDYYDRVIRNETHFETVYRYILDNPIKAHLPDAERRIYSVYE